MIGLAAEGPADDRAARRSLIAEGRSLLSYVQGRPASPTLIRRYVRGVVRVRGASPLRLPGIALRYPGYLRFFEPIGGTRSREQAERVARLDIATSLVAASPEGARRFFALEQRGRGATAAGLAAALAGEMFLMPVRLLITLSGR